MRSLGNLELSDRNSPLASTIAIISCFVVKLLSTTVQASDQEQHKVKEQTCTQNLLFAAGRFYECRAGTVTTGNDFRLTATFRAYVPSTLRRRCLRSDLPNDLDHFGA